MELGLPSKEIGCQELIPSFNHGNSNSVIEEIFKEASNQNTVLILDEIELLFSRNNRLLDLFQGVKEIVELLRFFFLSSFFFFFPSIFIFHFHFHFHFLISSSY